MKESFIDKRLTAVGAKTEVIEAVTIFAVIITAALILPIALFGQKGFFAEYNQLFIGPLVNCVLIIAALNFRGRIKTAAVVLLPSVLATTVGLIGFMGVYAMYMIPILWAGNTLLVLSFKFFHVHRRANFALVAFLTIMAKAALIFGGFQLLVLFGAIPAVPSQAMMLGMGLYQLITATVGSILAFTAIKLFYKKAPRA